VPSIRFTRSIPPFQHGAVEGLFIHLHQSRRIPTADERREFFIARKELRSEFAVIARRIEEAAANPILKLIELAPLRQLAFEALVVMRRIQGELESAVLSGLVLPPAELASLMDLNVEQLLRLQGRLAILECFASVIDELQPAVRELVSTGVCRSAPFRKAARQLIVELPRIPGCLAMLLEIAPLVSNFLARRDATGEAPLFANGLACAALLALCVVAEAEPEVRLEPLVVASLVQDVGLLVLLAARDCTADRLAIEDPAWFAMHAAVGAAIAGGICDCAADLPLLVAAHHERIDGTGPARMPARRLSSSARLLAVATRFVELFQDAAARQPEGRDDTLHLLRGTADKLHREALQGEFDLERTESFLDRVRIDVQTAYGLTLSKTLDEFLLEPFSSFQRRVDGPHTVEIAGPHFPSPRAQREFRTHQDTAEGHRDAADDSLPREPRSPVSQPHFLQPPRRTRTESRERRS
jgi:hypothetical protein